TVLYVLAETIRHVAILTQPFVPAASAKILDQLAVLQERRKLSHLDPAYRLSSGTPLPKPEGVFPRYVESEPAPESESNSDR
ncbi:MAG: methionine--tRNA ligase, partial [Alphaproteobacteria bacterium]